MRGTGLFANKWEKINLNIISLIQGDYAAASCMICYAALLGKVDLFQLWLLITFQCIFYGLAEAIGVEVLGAVDVGGSIFVHTFGAYFGIMSSFFFNTNRAIEDAENRN